jgi:hypothetical protein
MNPTSRIRPVLFALAAVTVTLLGALSLPAIAGPNDPVEDVRTRTAPVAPPAAQDLPEPGTLALVGIGLVGLGWLRRSKR